MAWNKLTNEEFIKRVTESNQYIANGNIRIRGQYRGMQSRIECECIRHDILWNPYASSLLLGCGCIKCGNEKTGKKSSAPYEDFITALSLLDNGIVTVGEYINMTTPIDFQCTHNHIWSDKPTNIIHGKGCPYCANARVWVGYNDMWTTRPDVAKILKNSEDGYKYTSGSNKKAEFVCPSCGSISKKNIASVSSRGLCCQVCSDGISYPNKFIRQVLKQLHVGFISEYSPDWAKPRKYDCYFKHNQQEYIVEMDGAFHYMDRESIKVSAVESQANDELKTRLATQHGINIIRIECIESQVDYIKNRILSSALNDIFDLSNIDWDLCDAISQKSLVKEACDLYMSETHDVNKIANILDIHSKTARDYLKFGVKFGWCDYSNQQIKAVVVIDNNNSILHYFQSGASCSRGMEQIYGIPFGASHIINSCKTHKPYKGFNFRYANEIIQN